MGSAADLADYCRRSIAAEPKWSYRQFRPMTGLGKSPDVAQEADCSSHATQAYFWADAPDPNGEGYSGYGYTGTLVNNPRCSSPYEVGDMGIYGTSTGNTTHVVTCYAAGSSSSALWCSHGSDAGPYSVVLHYRSDLLCVVRPGLGDGGGGTVDVPAWFWDWSYWYLCTDRDKANRPENAPEKIPEWAWDYMNEVNRCCEAFGMTGGERDWLEWYNAGKQGARPDVPDKVPDRWWDDQKWHHGIVTP